MSIICFTSLQAAPLLALAHTQSRRFFGSPPLSWPPNQTQKKMQKDPVTRIFIQRQQTDTILKETPLPPTQSFMNRIWSSIGMNPEPFANQIKEAEQNGYNRGLADGFRAAEHQSRIEKKQKYSEGLQQGSLGGFCLSSLFTIWVLKK